MIDSMGAKGSGKLAGDRGRELLHGCCGFSRILLHGREACHDGLVLVLNELLERTLIRRR